ncbi:DUF808 family protein [Persephonella sp.]|uniref:DUF808 domain-containing protein n=1 Tax=Persephonella sp. TaxID=2060922 RepID=UPI00261D57E8|nr:DUF808 family protein [Persephonella sp.]
MASGIFALLDDIAYLMDDVASSTKIAAQKTSAVLGDDLAVGAKKASEYPPSRELPVLWAIIKGSFLNKLIVVPFILALNYFLPFIIKPVLMIGGLYLAYEGAEKILEFLDLVKHHSEERKLSEKEKIKSAIITDFILSLEIVIIAISTVQDKPFLVQVISVSIVAVLATIGVYGFVALIVRLDDMGIYLIENYDGFLEKIGILMVKSLPYIIKALSVIGTLAMLLVAGGIYLHSLEFLHHLTEPIPALIGEFLIGLILGIFAFFTKQLTSSFLHRS